ncbi:MAG: AIR synthase-related protein [Candidatus Acetothermia bacterium]
MSTDSPPLGKFGKNRLEKYVFPYLEREGGRRPDLKYGSDFNTVETGEENVLVVSSDPLAISPQLGWGRSGGLALQVITTDVAVSGIAPSHLVVNWNLPPKMEDEAFSEVWQGFTDEARSVKAEIVGGHTGRYEGQNFPIVGAGTALGFGEKEDLLNGEVKEGDGVYLLNELGVEAAGIFAFYYPEFLAERTSNDLLEKIKVKFDALQPTRKLLKLASLPGVEVLHDVAEGGFLGGIEEILADRKLGARVYGDEIEFDPDVAEVCRQLDLDPLKVTSLGSGIAVVSTGTEDKFLRGAAENNLEIEKAGEITESRDIELVTEDGMKNITEPGRDLFWKRLSEFEKERG